jgi:hypothetical protein
MEIRWLTAFLDFAPEGFEPGVAFWVAVTGTTLSPLRGAYDELATLEPPDGDAYLRVQRVRAETGPIHLDLHVDDVPAFARRAETIGAAEVHAAEGVAVLHSPGGFTFCLVGWHGETTRPARPVAVVDQVCLDIAPSLQEKERSFWTALTGWRRRDGSRAEFSSLTRPGQPLRLLLQRLDAEPGAPVSAHLDLAADGRVEEVVARHESLGAGVVRRTEGWTTMRDPVGREYCVTSRDPQPSPATH